MLRMDWITRIKKSKSGEEGNYSFGSLRDPPTKLPE